MHLEVKDKMLLQLLSTPIVRSRSVFLSATALLNRLQQVLTS